MGSIAGGPAPLIATWLWTGKYNLETKFFAIHLSSPFPTKQPYIISGYILVCCVIGFLATLALRDRQAYDHTQEYDEQEVAPATGVRRPAAG